MAKDYYQILGVARTASDKVIKRAYRKLAMQYHPDRNPGKEKWANEKVKEINEAFSVLGDPAKKKQYDQFGTLGNAGDIFSSHYTRASFEDLIKDFGGAGLGSGFLDDIFGDFLKGKGTSFSFKGFGGPGGIRYESRPPGGVNVENSFRQTQRAARTRQRDVRYELAISQAEALQGTKKLLTRKGKRLEVRIPPGVKSGSVVKLDNALWMTDGKPGDIVIRIKVE